MVFHSLFENMPQIYMPEINILNFGILKGISLDLMIMNYLEF